MSRDALAESRRGNPPAVLVLVHGLSYGTWYWDFPYQPERYSTVNYLNQHGYATLNIDRIGIGRSGHPLSALATVPAQAAVVHQLIQKLKDGTIAGIRFPHTGLVGHSLGSIITYTETALYNDTEVNIGTGYSTRLNLLTAGSFAALATPAALSPVTSMQPWAIDPGYLQALPAGREVPQLYYQPNTDPGVVQKDKELANGASVGEWLTFFEGAYDGTYKHIKVPTFVINGEFDTLACGDNAIYCATDATSDAGPADLELSGQRFAAWEAPALNPGACLRAAVVPDAAHDVALHRNARQFQRLVAYFADQAMGVRGQQAADYRRSCVSTATSETASMLPELDRPLPPLTPPPPEAVITPLAETIDS
ncbi:alpha/beta hydrolase [Prauserella shujinwangii]|nr:alpha/beta fold hydrolase [Prauserella shujinwangii]